MAGGLFKLLGALVLVVATVVLLAGIGAVGFGFMDEQDNEGSLLFGKDEERTDRNQAAVIGGGAAIGTGVLLLLIGVILIVTGGWLAGRELKREIAKRLEPAPSSR